MALSPSQRVQLIKETLHRLKNDPWPIISVTMKQFSLGISDEWSGSKDAYILECASSASDQTLIDLANHAGYEFSDNSVPSIDPPFWQTNTLRLFVSHLSTERIYAAQLQAALSGLGISAFIAHNDIEPTLEWQSQIELALSTCDVLIALMHDGFHKSNWCDHEIGIAIGRRVPTFPVRFNQDPYGFIARYQAFIGKDKSASELARELFDAFRKNKQTQNRMCDAVVALFERSGSYKRTRHETEFYAR